MVQVAVDLHPKMAANPHLHVSIEPLHKGTGIKATPRHMDHWSAGLSGEAPEPRTAMGEYVSNRLVRCQTSQVPLNGRAVSRSSSTPRRCNHPSSDRASLRRQSTHLRRFLESGGWQANCGSGPGSWCRHRRLPGRPTVDGRSERLRLTKRNARELLSGNNRRTATAHERSKRKV